MALTQVSTDGIKDGEIKNADVNASAAIDGSKLVAATASVPGSMSAADKAKLDAVEASADVTDATNVNAAGAVMNTDIVTKGHILVGDGSGDPTAVSVGTNTYVLTADSSTGTGVTWAAPAVTYDDTAVKNQIAMLGFYRATDNSKAKFNLVDQVIDGFHDTTGIDAANSTNESHDNTNKLYKGESVAYATGGTITSYSSGGTTYKVHSFLANGTFTPPSSGSGLQHMIVAGGGGGGTFGGGGAGAMIVTTSQAVTAQGYAMVVGGGGASNANGYASTGFGISATGGGNGGDTSSGSAAAGGSGGGDGPWCGGSYYCQNPGSGTTGGNNGGNAYDDNRMDAAPYKAGGGGGGAGAVGSNGNTQNGGAGGAGLQNDYRTGSGVYYAGGGGGAGQENNGATTATHGGGGAGGGGDGARHYTGGNDSVAGTANTGGGGGGGATGAAGGAGKAGGSGIIVIRYPDDTFTAAGGDLTLQSVATTASASPSKTDIVIMIEDNEGTATINTDLKAYTSKDGSTFTEHTLVDEGTWGTDKRVFAAHDVTPGGSSGTSMKWKITTHNQSAGSKETYVHGVSLGWH
jgi:hypothetical protein